MSARASKKPAAAKPKGKAAAKPKAEKTQKTIDENNRYNAAVDGCVTNEFIGDFASLNTRSFAEKCGTALSTYILACIDNIQKAEVVDAKSYNPYPAESYVLLEEKLGGASKVRSIKTKNGKTELPKKKRVPRKKGATVSDTTDDAESEPDTQADAQAQAQAQAQVEEKSEDSDSQTKPEETEEKKHSKKNIVQVTKNGKTWLSFIVNRFTWEMYSTDCDKPIKNDEEFVKFSMNVTKDFSSQISRTVVPTVERLGSTVNSIKDYEFNRQIATAIDEYFSSNSLSNYLAKYLVNYFKLIAVVLAQQIWVSNKSSITGAEVEKVMRVLDVGNHEFMVKGNFVERDQCDFGLTNGVLVHAREYDNAVNPPLSEEEKKARAEKRAAGKGKEKPKAKAKAKAKASAKDEPEEDAEAEAEAEQEEEAEADAEAEAEEEEVEIDVEEEPEPAPAAKPAAKSVPAPAPAPAATNAAAKVVRKLVPNKPTAK